MVTKKRTGGRFLRLSTGRIIPRMHTPKSWLAVQAAVRVCGATIAEAATASSLASGAVRVGAAVVGSHQRQQAVAPSNMVQAATAHQGQPCSYHAQRREGSPGREIRRPLQVISASPPCRGPPRARSHDGGCQCAAAGRAGSPNAPHNFSLNETETAGVAPVPSMHFSLSVRWQLPIICIAARRASISPSQGGGLQIEETTRVHLPPLGVQYLALQRFARSVCACHCLRWQMPHSQISQRCTTALWFGRTRTARSRAADTVAWRLSSLLLGAGEGPSWCRLPTCTSSACTSNEFGQQVGLPLHDPCPRQVTHVGFSRTT